MHVVGSGKRNIQFFAHFYKQRVYPFLIRKTVILNFQIKIVLINIFKHKRGLFRALVIVADEPPLHAPRKACGKADKPFAVLFKRFIVYSRLIIKPVHIGYGIEFYEIFIPLFVFAKKYKVIERLFFRFVRIIVANIHFATGYILYPRLFCFFREIKCAEHVAVVGYRHGIHSAFFAGFEKFVYTSRPVEQTVFGM